MLLRRSRLLTAACLAVAAAATIPVSVTAQSVDDALMIGRKTIMVGATYTHDAWEQYWEGTLKRTNGNIGTITTQTATLMAGYGLTSRVTLLAMLPYVRTEASQGTLQSMDGVQDLTVAAKVRLFSSEPDERGLSAYFVASGALPASDYTPDLMPLSIGSGGSRTAARLTLGYRPTQGPFFAVASGAYTFCNNVTLDRNAYYTNGQLHLTNDVAMPNVADYNLAAGIRTGRWMIPVSVAQLTTLGGGDIRRQDMPFVSNRMNATRIGAEVMYSVPRAGGLSLRAGAGRVIAGRNVGQSTSLMTGVMYAF